MDNQHVNPIPPEVLAQAQANIDATITLLLPYLLSLTPAERHGLAKMGEKTLSFVSKAYEFADHNAQFRPSYLDMSAFQVDVTDATGLYTLANSAKQLLEAIDDTSMLAGSEAYQSALVYYNAVKQAAKQDVLGAKAIYEDLRARFHKSRRNSETNADANVEN